MISYTYSSGIAGVIIAFIELKQASGYPYQSSSRILSVFDGMITERFPDANTITKEICNKWIHYKPDEHPNGLLRRVTPVRQLAKYMNGIGVSSYILPGHIPNKQIRYEAHIYTEEELKSFFHSIDQCHGSPFSPTRCYVIPTLFRMIYCCGLRSSEALLLTMEDVDLETGRIIIRESKGWRARIIYMRQDLLDVCVEYNVIMQRMVHDRSAFFPNKDGRFFSRSNVDRWFHEFWDTLPVSDKVVGNSPRVHDFRHTYAVDRLNSWVRQGQDINCLYPYLSEYMGHSNYADTDYYLSLVDSFYPEMEKRLASLNEAILPEVKYYEEE